MDNYPAGAAHDPQAPYNEQEVEVEVVATATMQQITTVWIDPEHYAVSDGGYEIPEIDLQEAFENENEPLQETLRRCLKVLRAITAKGKTFYDGVYLTTLIMQLEAWSQEEFKVERT